MKQQYIGIDLFPEKIDIDLNIKEMWEELKNTNEKIDNLLIENKEKDNKINDLTNEIIEIKNEINNLKNDKNELKRETDILKNKNQELIQKYEEINQVIYFMKDTKSDTSMIMNRYEEESFVFGEIEKK